MDELTKFADKMFLTKVNQLTGLDKQSTNILEKKSLGLLFRDYKAGWKPHHQLRLRPHNPICADTTDINRDNVTQRMELQLVSLPAAAQPAAPRGTC